MPGFEQMGDEINARGGAQPALQARPPDRALLHSVGSVSSVGTGIVMEKEAW